MDSDDKDDKKEDSFSVGSKSNENIEAVLDDDDFVDTNEDVTLNDVTEKFVSDSNGVETNIEIDETNTSLQSHRSDEMTHRSEERTHRSQISEQSHEGNQLDDNDIDQEEIRNEDIYKLESDPFYLPGDFPTLPLDFNNESWPNSYKENTLKEELCLEFVENFTRQYCHLYGDRRPLFIKPLNECGIPKMVCTTINATKLPFPDLHYWEGAATFVADYLTMVPVVPCTNTPRRLLSPTTTLSLQRGTCYELANLLCSLLVGVGYNAYVVNGYATRETCFMDRSRDNCPLLTSIENVSNERQESSNKRYTVRPPKDLTSKFELDQELKRIKIENDRLKRIEDEIKEGERLEEQPRSDPLYGQRVHAWVLVLAGKREIGESFFIEALTGKASSVSSTDYLGIESVWNNKNYWVNMQVGAGGVSNLNYDLNNTSFWEYVLAGQETVLLGPPIELPAGYDGTEAEESHSAATVEKHFDLPKSWTSTISVSLKEFEHRCSEGRKETIYKKARLEKFSPYVCNDGIVTRIRQYEDRMLHKPTEVVEYFQHRNDKLFKKVADLSTEMIFEYFEPGRKSRLAEHHYHSDKTNRNQVRTMKFYFGARADCLMELEDSDTKLVTRYRGREDFLVARIITFGKREKKFGPANEREYQRPFETIIEHYSRNKDAEANKDIREVIFHLTDFRILVSFHTADSNIVGDMVEFIKSQSSGDPRRGSVVTLGKDACTYFQVDPYKQKLTDVETYEYYLGLLEKEENSKLMIRKEEIEIKEILKIRDEENMSNTMEVSLFDRVRNVEANTTRVEMERMIEVDKYRVKDEELDYLEPFLLQLDICKDDEISKEKALQLYQKCLQDFKQRLIDKANMLQVRFEVETAKLQEKQQWYQLNQSVMQKTDEQEYLQFCNEVTFKINTLEKMLARHKKTIEYKETLLDQRLRSDQRISRHLIVK